MSIETVAVILFAISNPTIDQIISNTREEEHIRVAIDCIVYYLLILLQQLLVVVIVV